MTHAQPDLFQADATLPEGLRYQPELITPAEEARLIEAIADLPFKPFEFHGYLGKRRVVAFGWRYDYSARRGRSRAHARLPPAAARAGGRLRPAA